MAYLFLMIQRTSVRIVAAIPLCLCLVFAVTKMRAQGQSEWSHVTVPNVWKSQVSNGFSWYRCLVEIPAAWNDRPIELFVESVDDAREIYFNGQLVGTLGTFPPEYRSGLGRSTQFEIPTELALRGQRNLVAIRVHENQSRGGFNVAAPVVFGGDEAIRLKGIWQRQSGDDASGSLLSARASVSSEAIFSKIESAESIRQTLKQLDDDKGPLNLADSLAQLTTPSDVAVKLAVGEPDVRQPLSMKWDAKGRLWVVQYLQYPDPAGLRMISRDKYLRTVYDRIPPAPPNHFKGRDKITIHEDTDGDGVYDHHKTFVDGLNLATSIALGRGGVWVLNPPYLLFYPDRNQDDVPDGDPEVRLEGFGLEDSHSIANSIRWGPDGWLYAAQGSTVSGRIKQPGTDAAPHVSMGQLIWRYHPQTRRYEVFAEGGGNTFGVEIDEKGRTYSGHNGGDTRGFHYVQGGYYRKGFGKHGQLSNPFTFGYLPWISHHKVPRFTHTFVIYEADGLPARLRGKLFGVGPLQGHVVQSQVARDGSTFATKDEGCLLESKDKWFRPVDIQIGPDGSLYVADFYEQRIDHASHYQGRIHRDSGRIYRLRSRNANSVGKVDLATRSTPELLNALSHDNRWYRQTALRLIADRQDRSIVPLLESRLETAPDEFTLEQLWALNLTTGLSENVALSALDHADPFVRVWTIRLLCDERTVSDLIAARLAGLARTDPDVEVRSQLACSARRLSAHQGLAIIRNLLQRSEDLEDPHLPLLLWWAIEDKVSGNHDVIAEMFQDRQLWKSEMVRQHIQSRLMRRYAQDGRRTALMVCATLLRLAPTQEDATRLLAGFDEAFKGRSMAEIPDELAAAIIDAGGGSLTLRMRRGEARAIKQAMAYVANDKMKSEDRIEAIRVFGELRHRPVIPRLMQLLTSSQNDNVLKAAVQALQSFPDPDIGKGVIERYANVGASIQPAVQNLLASRASWSKQLTAAIQQGSMAAETIPETVVRKMLLHRDSQLKESIDNIWGTVEAATTDAMLAEIDRLTAVIKAGSGIPHNGKPLFTQRCGKCHKLFENGNDVGPDLTAYDRSDLPRILNNVVNPSLETREGFQQQILITTDGQVLSGLIVDEDNLVIVLKDAEGETHIVSREDIDELVKSRQSLMPESTLVDLTDQELRDLFAYLRSSQPLP